jgi:hypothetical protein
VRERWWSRRAIFIHLGFLVFVPFCGVATWWQISRAEDGNGLSYLYSFEWPAFAAIGVYFWWMLLHIDFETVGLRGLRRHTGTLSDDPSVQALRDEATTVGGGGLPSVSICSASQSNTSTPSVAPTTEAGMVEAGDDAEDPDLAAYNARLAALAAQGPKTWRKPESTVVRRPQ